MSPTRREWGVAASALWALLLLFFAPPLLAGVVLAPADGIAQDLPLRMLAAEAIKHGEMPFWNPFSFSGTPLLAGIQIGFFFPANWGFLVLPYDLAMNISVLLGYWLAGFGTYALGRELRMPVVAAAFSAIAFMLGGYLVQNLEHVMMLHAAGMMAVLLFLVARFARTREVRYAQAGAFAVALLFLAGHPQMAAYAMLLAFAYAIYRGFGWERGERRRYAASLGAMFALGLGLTSAQLLITLDLIASSQRAAIAYAKLTTFSLPPFGLVTLVVPFLFGVRHPTEWLAAPYWGQLAWQYWTHAYVGLATVAAAIIGAAGFRQQPEARFWGGASLFTLLLMLGDHTPLYRLWSLLPVFKMMPYPHRHGIEFTFSMAIMAGLGLATMLALTEAGPRKRLALWGAGLTGGAVLVTIAAVALLGPGFARRTQPLMPANIDLTQILSLSQPTFWLPALFALLTAGLLAGLALRRRPGFAWGLALLLAADLGLAGYFNGRWHQAPRHPDLSTDRLYQFSESRHLTIPDEPYPYNQDYAKLRALHYPNLAAFEGLRSANGYDAFILARYGQLLQMGSLGHLHSQAVWSGAHHGLNMLGVKTIRLAPKVAATPAWRARMAGERFVRLPQQGELTVLENIQALPRAWRPERITRLTSDQVDQRVSRDPRFEPLLETLVEAPLPKAIWTEGNAEARTVGLNRIALTTSAPGPGLVVVSESYDPGWRAYHQGRELPVRRANGVLLAVEVPMGLVDVALVYEPRLWKWGVALSLLALGLLALWAGRSRRTVKEMSVVP